MNTEHDLLTRGPGGASTGRAIRLALVSLDLFVALTAVGGGIALASGVEGDRFPIEWLAGTPFGSYLVPGLMLAFIVGGSAAVSAAAMLRSRQLGARASLLAGVVLMGWIIGEVLILRTPAAHSWAELVYFALGFVMAALAFFTVHRRPERI